MANSVYATAETCVFWDLVGCPIPEGQDPSSVYQNLKSALTNLGYTGNVSVRAYCDNSQIPDEFESAGITLVPSGETRGRELSASSRKMIWDIFSRTMDHGNEPSSLMVISRDNDEFASALIGLKQRGFNILLAQPEDAGQCLGCRAPMAEFSFASSEWVWSTLAAGGDPISAATTTANNEITQDCDHGHGHGHQG